MTALKQDGIDASTRATIFKQANIGAEESTAVLNLGSLGVTLQTVRFQTLLSSVIVLCFSFEACISFRVNQSNQKAKGLRIKPEQMEKYAERAREVPMELMRFLPLLQEILHELVHGKLSTSGLATKTSKTDIILYLW